MQENENPFGPQPNLDAVPAPEASTPVVDQPVAQPVVDATAQSAIDVAAQPVVNTQPASAQPVADAPVVGSNTKKPSKGLIIGIIAGVVVVVAIILGIIFIPMLFAPDYEDANEKISAFHDAVSEVNYGDACSSVGSEFSDKDVDDEKYEKYATKCLEELEEMNNALNELGKSTGVKNDKEHKELFDKLKASHDIVVPKMKDYIELSKASHSFVANTRYISNVEKITDTQIDKMTEKMSSSSNKIAKEYGPKLNSALKAYVKAYKAYKNALNDSGYSYSKYAEYRDAYYEKEEEFEEIADKFSKAVEEEYTDAIEDEGDNLTDIANELEEKIFRKYLDSE